MSVERLADFPFEEEFARPRPAIDPNATIRLMNVTVKQDRGPPHPLSKLTMEKEAPFIRMFGVTPEGYSACVRVHGFLPYFYAEIREPSLLALLRAGKRNAGAVTTAANKVKSVLESASARVMSVEPMRRTNIMGWQPDEQWMWKITTLLPMSVSAMRNMIQPETKPGVEPRGVLSAPECGACNKTFESNVLFEMRFMDDVGVPGMGVVDVPPGRRMLASPGLPQGSGGATLPMESFTHVEVDVHYEDMCPLPYTQQQNMPIRVMSLDIEAETQKRDQFPFPERDAIGCICMKMWEKQTDGIWRPFRGFGVTWHRARMPKGQSKTDVLWVSQSEAEMLLYFSKFLRLFDPDIITGHNTNGFDLNYILRRISVLKLERFSGLWDDPMVLGRLRNKRSYVDVKKMESGAMGKVEYKLAIMPGRNASFDNQVLRQRGMEKYKSYRLEDIAQQEIGYGKDNVQYWEITPDLNSGDPERVWRIIQYCYRDAELPFLIMMRHNDVENYQEMARLCMVPFRLLIESGQQIRNQSLLLANELVAGKFVLPFNRVPQTKKKRSGKKDFQGATVFEPEVDYYRCDDIPAAREVLEAELRGLPNMGQESDAESESEDEMNLDAERRTLIQRSLLDSCIGNEALEDLLPEDVRRLRADLRRNVQKPVATLDFASLYPSIMISSNLSYDTWVEAHRLAEARARGLPLWRMANGEWFIDPWDPIEIEPGETIEEVVKRLRGEGRMVEQKCDIVRVARVEDAPEEERAAVKEMEEYETYKNFKPVETSLRRFWGYERVTWKVRNEDRVGVLVALLERLLAARKVAKGDMGRAQGRVKMLSDTLGLWMLLFGDNDETTNKQALGVIWGGKQQKKFASAFPDGFVGSGRRAEIMKEVLIWLVGQKETKEHWKNVRGRLLEYLEASLGKVTAAFAQDEALAPLKQGVVHIGEAKDAMLVRIEHWQREAAAHDARQQALKVVCNSVYGSTGATVGKLPCLAISSAVTAQGRMMLEQCKRICEQYDPETGLYAHGDSKHKLDCVYGDSVTGDTPVLARFGYFQRTIPIAELVYVVSERWKAWRGGKQCFNPEDVEVWSDAGWTPVRRVIRHVVPASKRIVSVRTRTGVVNCTDEHSLLRYGAPRESERVDAKDVQKGLRIVHARMPRARDSAAGQSSLEYYRSVGEAYAMSSDGIPDMVGESDRDHMCAFFEAYVGKRKMLTFPSQVTAAKFAMLVDQIGYTPLVHNRSKHGPRVYCVTWQSGGDPAALETILEVRDVEHGECFVYDLETVNQHFSAGVGRIVVHNTDSVFISMEGCESMEEAFGIAAKLATRCTKSFYSSKIKLELEKIFKRLILMSKKRYTGIKMEYNQNGDPVLVGMNKGSEEVRRDVAPVVKGTIQAAIAKVFEEDDLDGAIRLVRQTVARMMAGEIPIEDYVLSKGISKDEEDYAAKQAHIELQKRKMQRTPGLTMEKGTRVPFVYVGALAGTKAIDMVEDPIYAQEHNIPVNVKYYLENQLMKPLCRFFGPLLSPSSATKEERLAYARHVLFESTTTGFHSVAAVRDGWMRNWIEQKELTAAQEDAKLTNEMDALMCEPLRRYNFGVRNEMEDEEQKRRKRERAEAAAAAPVNRKRARQMKMTDF